MAPGPGGAAERARPRGSRGRGAAGHVAGGAGFTGGRDGATRLSTAASSCLPDPAPFPFPSVHVPPRPCLPSASPPFLLCFTTCSSSSCSRRLPPAVTEAFPRPPPPPPGCSWRPPASLRATSALTCPQSLTDGSHGEQVHTEVVAGFPFNSRPEQAVLVKNTFPKVEINVFMCKLIHSYHKNIKMSDNTERQSVDGGNHPHPLLGDKHSEGAGWAPGLLRSLLVPRSRWGPAGLTVRSPLSSATPGRGAAVPGSGSQRWACAGEWGGVGTNGITSHRTRWFCLCVLVVCLSSA